MKGDRPFHRTLSVKRRRSASHEISILNAQVLIDNGSRWSVGIDIDEQHAPLTQAAQQDIAAFEGFLGGQHVVHLLLVRRLRNAESGDLRLTHEREENDVLRG